MPHDLTMVMALAWVFGAVLLTQSSDEPFFIPSEVLQIIFETTSGGCPETCSIPINQVNNHCTSYFSAYLLNTLNVIDDLIWHLSPF